MKLEKFIKSSWNSEIRLKLWNLVRNFEILKFDQNHEKSREQCPAGRVFQYRVGFGWGESVKKYDRVFPGIFFSLRYFRVFRVFPGMSGIFGYFWVYPYILGLFSNIQ